MSESPTDAYTVIVIDTDGRVAKQTIRYDRETDIGHVVLMVGKAAHEGVWSLERRRQKGDSRMQTLFDRLFTNAIAAIENAIVSYVSVGEEDDDDDA